MILKNMKICFLYIQVLKDSPSSYIRNVVHLCVNSISQQQKQGANGEWATGYLEPCIGLQSSCFQF